MPETRPEAFGLWLVVACPSRRHDCSVVRLKNAPSSDVFSHNKKRPSGHANTSCHFASGAARDWRGRLHGSAAHQPTDRTAIELKSLHARTAVRACRSPSDGATGIDLHGL